MDDPLPKSRKAIPDLVPDTRILVSILQKVQPDDTVGYAQLNDAIGRDVQQAARYILQSARNIAARDHGAVFGVISRVGLKRLTPAEVPAIGDSAMKSIRRKARRTMKHMQYGTDGHQLSNGDQIRLNARMSALGALYLFGQESSVKKIEAKLANDGTEQLAVGTTLRLFAQ
jgi:hypothetical protein